jgi:hypothetical protein
MASKYVLDRFDALSGVLRENGFCAGKTPDESRAAYRRLIQIVDEMAKGMAGEMLVAARVEWEEAMDEVAGAVHERLVEQISYPQ